MQYSFDPFLFFTAVILQLETNTKKLYPALLHSMKKKKKKKKEGRKELYLQENMCNEHHLARKQICTYGRFGTTLFSPSISVPNKPLFNSYQLLKTRFLAALYNKVLL